MKDRRIVSTALMALALLGGSVGFAAAGTNAPASGGDRHHDSTTSNTTTRPSTTTAPTTTSAPTTTQATTQTSPGTTAGSPPPTTTGATTTPPPTAPCDTTQITCGNNASTQIAVVSQTCNAASSSGPVVVNVTDVSGKPIDSYTVGNVTSCQNVLNLTQIVQQFCINCTIIVLPPAVTTAPAVAAPPPPPRALYCTPQPVLRTDGTWGTFVDLVAGQPSTDPRYAGAVPATFTPGVGYSCPSGAATTAASAPMFTLTVPAAFVGQFVNLCILAADPGQKPTCHQVRIDQGATITIPVTSNIAATVTQTVAAPAKSHKQVARASKAFATAGHPKAKKTKQVRH